jgi:hypothetical protein
VCDSLVSPAVSTIITHADPPGSGTGGGLHVQRWTGFTRSGSSAIKQVAIKTTAPPRLLRRVTVSEASSGGPPRRRVRELEAEVEMW